MSRITIIILFVAMTVSTIAQTYLPITNNMVVGSYSNIKLAAGNYQFSDAPADGVIQLNGVQNVVLDGDSCRVNGLLKQGYMIKVANSHNVTIKNFDSVFGYKYAVYITNSDHININGNVFCRNKVDSSGWIDVWADYSQALGGGVMMYQSRAAHIHDNIMTMQNDGVALYHCDSVNIHNNDFSWNTSYGIRMFWTDTCHIWQNNCSHVNRPLTDPSDCAALLMIVSNASRVENNDLSWSGDGVFLGQYQHSNTPNNNYFAWNECSYSPHNAIEATFADGNVYKHNSCNYSHYGLWLGYSFNSVVDSNDISGNYQSGIAIDRGFNNLISNNTIRNNPIGIELWEGSPISGYATFHSQDYPILSNNFEGNTRAVSSVNTKHLQLRSNEFNYSQAASVYLDGTSATDTISGNTFRMATGFHIYNNSIYPKNSPGNLFSPSDTALISAKTFDVHDNPAKGAVTWEPPLPSPPTPVQLAPPCDMAEPASLWYAYPETGYPAKIRFGDSVYFDSTEKKVGAASVRLVTSRGYDVALNYRPANDSLSQWQPAETDSLFFWVRTIKQPQYGFQYFSVRLGDDRGNYYKYTAPVSLLNAANNTWKRYSFPLSGNGQFSRTVTGAMTLDKLNYVEFHADTWDYGFTLWVDGVQFTSCTPVILSGNEKTKEITSLACNPNPFASETRIIFTLPEPGTFRLEIVNAQGRTVAILANGFYSAGPHAVSWNPTSAIPAGIYLARLVAAGETHTARVVIVR